MINGSPLADITKDTGGSVLFEPYFQDDWKVNRRLTLNMGIRYYLFAPIHDVSHPVNR